MTHKKHLARQALTAAAETLATEIWEHKWDHVPEVKALPIGEWVAMLHELERRCPGHSSEAYRNAIAGELGRHCLFRCSLLNQADQRV
jgi:hypothetical protein